MTTFCNDLKLFTSTLDFAVRALPQISLFRVRGTLSRTVWDKKRALMVLDANILLQDEGLIFLWVTGRAMELGRECLKLWGYERVDEIIWVKTNQLVSSVSFPNCQFKYNGIQRRGWMLIKKQCDFRTPLIKAYHNWRAMSSIDCIALQFFNMGLSRPRFGSFILSLGVLITLDGLAKLLIMMLGNRKEERKYLLLYERLR